MRTQKHALQGSDDSLLCSMCGERELVAETASRVCDRCQPVAGTAQIDTTATDEEGAS